MNARIAWNNLAAAISDMQQPGGDHVLKLDTVLAGVQLLLEFPAAEILREVERSALPKRAIVSWLVYEGARLPGVDPGVVQGLRDRYESTCPAGQGIIPPPPDRGRIGLA